MPQSLNRTADFMIQASWLGGLNAYGRILIGDRAFEFYNDRNVQQFVQIPWENIEYIAASVYFKKYISRFVVRTTDGIQYTFGSRNSRKLLSRCRRYLPDDKLVQSLSLMQAVRLKFRTKSSAAA